MVILVTFVKQFYTIICYLVNINYIDVFAQVWKSGKVVFGFQSAMNSYFVRSGYVNLTTTTGTLRYVGQNGGWWSSHGTATTGAHALDFNNTITHPSAGPNSRYHAFPLRCLSTVLGM